VRSPYPHARIVAINTAAAEALEGVVAVFTGADLADLKPFVPNLVEREEVLTPERPHLPTDKVRHVGEAVAVVVASSPYIAEDGRDLVDVAWEPLPVVVDPIEALRPDSLLLDESMGTNNVAHIENSAGDVDAAFAAAAHVFSKRFEVSASTAAPIGTRGVVAEYDERGGGHLTIYPTTQIPHLLRTHLAPVLGLAEGRITVNVPDVGGAFGLTCTIFPEDVVIPAIAMRLRRPVKWIEDRYENLAAAIHSKRMVTNMDIAVDDDGRFQAFRAHFLTEAGAYSSMPQTPLADALVAGQLLPAAYQVANVAYTADHVLTNKCQVGSVRGVGWTPAQLLRETLIDEVARGLGMDPVELRRRNLMSSEPQRNAFGASYDGGSYQQTLNLACETIGYDDFRARQAAARSEGRYLGIGFSPFIEPTGWGTKMAAVTGIGGELFDTASVRMDPDGSVTVSTGFHSHGQGHETTFAQVTADRLGVPIESVRIDYGNTENAAFGMGTYSSRSAVVGTGAITNAATDLRERLVHLSAEMLEADPDDILIEAGVATVRGVSSAAVSIAEVADFAYFGGERRPMDVQEHGLNITRSYASEETYANGCAAAVVEVDPETGMVSIEQLVAVEDCGIQLNPMIVKGQIAGAVAQGIGIALLEELAYTDSGEFISGNLMHYLYPTTAEVPMLDLRSIETPSSNTGGVKGVGEAGTISTPAAIVNAVADALSPFGVTINRAPVTPMYIRQILREAKQSKNSSG
jgi:CO/xanthine dehydrogenase Mo-binding subunit